MFRKQWEFCGMLFAVFIHGDSMKIFSKKGFSLLEIMIVIAIIGIMAVVAVPNFQTFLAQRRLNGATRQIAMQLMQARSEAITTNKKIIVSVSSNNHQYAFVTDNDGDETISSGDTTGTTRDIYPDYFDVTFTTNFNPVFRSDGTGKNPTIYVTSSMLGSALKKTITISTAGRIKIS
jgi:type IV fimbrial biogenesis protein FimT